MLPHFHQSSYRSFLILSFLCNQMRPTWTWGLQEFFQRPAESSIHPHTHAHTHTDTSLTHTSPTHRHWCVNERQRVGGEGRKGKLWFICHVSLQWALVMPVLYCFPSLCILRSFFIREDETIPACSCYTDWADAFFMLGWWEVGAVGWDRWPWNKLC